MLGDAKEERHMADKLNVGFLLFPELTQLDMTGPFEVLARVPDATVHLVAKSREPVRSDRGLAIVPTATYADCPRLDVLCVPGGPGVDALLTDPDTLDFVRRQADAARWVTSVCTGALVLGAAGLLKGKRATTHWMSHHLLEPLGAVPVKERIVRDGNIVTGGGVTAGIDFGLWLVGEIYGQEAAERVQLMIEYNPAPPFGAGSPEGAGPVRAAELRDMGKTGLQRRTDAVQQAAAQLP